MCTTVHQSVTVATRQLRTADYPDDACVRLGRAIEQARISLGYPSRPAFAELAGISLRSLTYAEQANRSVGPKVLYPIARALGWTPDTLRLILEGGDIPATTAPAEPAPRDPEVITEEEVDHAMLILYVHYRVLYGPDEARRRIAEHRAEIKEAAGKRSLRRQ